MVVNAHYSCQKKNHTSNAGIFITDYSTLCWCENWVHFEKLKPETMNSAAYSWTKRVEESAKYELNTHHKKKYIHFDLLTKATQSIEMLEFGLRNSRCPYLVSEQSCKIFTIFDNKIWRTQQQQLRNQTDSMIKNSTGKIEFKRIEPIDFSIEHKIPILLSNIVH